MRNARPLKTRGDMRSEDQRLFRQISQWMEQVDVAIAHLGRGTTPDQAQTVNPTPPSIDDHGNLKGLVPVLNPDSSVADMNDDHTHYALLYGRPGGQELYGSRPGDAALSWSPRGTFMLAAQTPGGGGSGTFNVATDEWQGIPCDANAPAATGIVLILSSHAVNDLAGGETAYHSSITDSQSNTWTKLKEYTYAHDGPPVQTETVSLWFCLVTSGLTATTSTLNVVFSTADQDRVSLEAYSFNMAAGLTVTLVDYDTDGSTITANPGTACPAMTLAAPDGEALFVRAISDQPSSGASAHIFAPTAGFTSFAADHTDACNGGVAMGTGFAFGQNAKGEFRVLTNTGTSSAPFYSDSDNHRMAAIFGAIQISGSGTGSLILGAANINDAAKIYLVDRDIRFVAGLNSGQFKFDPLGYGGFVGILDFDDITTSDKTYTFPNASGTIALTSDLAAYLKLDGSNDPMTGDLNFIDSVGVIFGTGNDTLLEYDGTNLVLDTSVAGTGAFKIQPTIHSSGAYSARQNILNIGHSALQGGTANTTAATVALGTITVTDAGLSSGQFGMAQGLDLTVTNTNTTKAGVPKSAVAPYALSTTFNLNTAVYGAADTAATKITATFTTESSILQTGLLATVSGASSSIGALTGVQGCQFKATNTHTSGDAKGFAGYGTVSSASSTGRGIGVFAYGSNSGLGANALSIAFLANTDGPGDSRQHYDIVGNKHAIHGALYITITTMNLKTSNPATHLTPPTATATPTADLFVEAHAEIDDTLWLDKVGDALVFTEGGNVVLGTTSGTKFGTAATQKQGWWGATPVVQDTGWSVSNVTTDRSFDADATSIDELADIVGTLINVLKTYGIIGA